MCSAKFELAKSLIEEILPRDIVQVIIEKDLEKGFDYRRISVKSHFKRPGEIK